MLTARLSSVLAERGKDSFDIVRRNNSLCCSFRSQDAPQAIGARQPRRAELPRNDRFEAKRKERRNGKTPVPGLQQHEYMGKLHPRTLSKRTRRPNHVGSTGRGRHSEFGPLSAALPDAGRNDDPSLQRQVQGLRAGMVGLRA